MQDKYIRYVRSIKITLSGHGSTDLGSGCILTADGTKPGPRLLPCDIQKIDHTSHVADNLIYHVVSISAVDMIYTDPSGSMRTDAHLIVPIADFLLITIGSITSSDGR